MSDVDALRGHYGPRFQMPVQAGHEGVGRITAVGSLVKALKVGDLVGLGVYRDCCNACVACVNGRTNHCPARRMMFLSPRGSPESEHHSGTFGDYVRIRAEFAFKIPDSPHFKGKEHLLAPLMCAGVTVFAPFKDFNVRPGQRVAILGVGGLGHLSMKFARAMGCQVFALSSTPDKEKACMEFGAHHFVHTGRTIKTGENCYLLPAGAGETAPLYDFIMMTQSGGNIKWHSLVQALSNIGTIVLMGNPTEGSTPPNLTPPAAGAPAGPPNMEELAKLTAMFTASFISSGKRICGCASGSRASAVEMLEFAAMHGILPNCETFDWNDIHKAIKKVDDGSIRYRAVIVHPSHKLHP